MAHSPAYFLATAVVDKDFSWVHATAAKITDPVIQQLIDKVRVGVSPTENVERYKQGATVAIRTRDGRVFRTPSTRRREQAGAALTGPTSTPSTARWCQERR